VKMTMVHMLNPVRNGCGLSQFQNLGIHFPKAITSVALAMIVLAFPPDGTVCAQERASLEKYRTEAPDSLAAHVPAALVKRVVADPERTLSDLVSHLVNGSGDPFLAVKRIHDWIALNIVYDISVRWEAAAADMVLGIGPTERSLLRVCEPVQGNDTARRIRLRNGWRICPRD